MNSVFPTKKMKASKPANPESGEAHNQPEETGTDRVISSDSFQDKLRQLMDSDASDKEDDEGKKPLIGEVPMLLGMEIELKKYFHPRILSIGPVHHNKNSNELKKGQLYKLQLAKRFIENSCESIENSRKSPEILYNNILNKIKTFKECYDHHEELLNKFEQDDRELAWMFFVDGCALIQFVKRYVLFGWIAFYYMDIDRDQVNVMATDLILLDNQLPLGVLKLIMGFIEEDDQHLRILIRDFAKEIMEMMHFEGWAEDEKADIGTDLTVKTENHMLELIWTNFVKKEIYYRSDNTKATSRQFRSVKDLQAAGIILEPNNSSSSLGDISFNRGTFFCNLKIPSFRVSEQGKFLVFNLIAFEMHPNFDKDRVVTSYISFLNSLIATKEDVAELRKAGILFNYLSIDEEVLKTFQELTSGLKPYPDIFSSTKEELINYFNDKKSMTTGKWLSEAMHVYFRSPWTTIAFGSATLLLILTIIQTVFSVLAYAQRR